MAECKRAKKRTSAKAESAREKRRRQRNKNVAVFLLCFGGAVLLLAFGIWMYRGAKAQETARWESLDPFAGAPPLDVQLLTPNEYSRPQLPLEKVNGIAIHYTANPGSSAMDNRNYFEGLKDSHETKASSHFIIGIDGEIVQCIPTAEMSYATNERNGDTISIECCHPDETGEFTEATYRSVVELSAWLCRRFGLTAEDVIRHYDVTGKECPRYYVQNPEAWERLRADIAKKTDSSEIPYGG